jgi:hypothetical protein
MAASADNAVIFAADAGPGGGGGGYLFASTDFGTTWRATLGNVLVANGGQSITQPGLRAWTALVCSADGRAAAAAVASGDVWITRNGGGLWVKAPGTAGKAWTALAASSDFSVLVAAAGADLFLSLNFGKTWGTAAVGKPAAAANAFAFTALAFGGNQLVALDTNGASTGAHTGLGYKFLLCPSGSFAAPGDAACTPCPAGSTSSAMLSTSCDVPCVAGTFAMSGDGPSVNSQGAPSCAACPQGQYQAAAGADGCTSCPTDWTTKPAAWFPAAPGATSAAACKETFRARDNAQLLLPGLSDGATAGIIVGVLGGIMTLAFTGTAFQLGLIRRK